MFDNIKTESRRELGLLSKRQNHDIKSVNKTQPTTNTILNDKIIIKKDFNSQRHHKTKIPVIKRNISSNHTKSDFYIRENENRNVNRNVRDYNHVCSKTVCYDKFIDDNYNNIFRNTNNSRIRKIFAMSSDIFNLNDSTQKYFAKTIYDFYSKRKTACLGNENNNVSLTRLNKTLSKIKRNKSKENDNEKKSIIHNAPKKLLEKKLQIFIDDVNSKKFNKSSYLLRKDFNKADTKALYTMRNKTNLSNISSVNYNIITTDPNYNINDKYVKYSNIKPEFTDYDNYEIIIPKNFNNTNESKLQSILHSNGLHYFNFKLEGDIVVGEKGKYTFNIRKSNLNTDKNDINKIIKKLEEKYNIKLKKNNKENKKKKSEITMKYGAEKICNHLQKENNTFKYGKKYNKFKYDIRYKNQYLYKNEKVQTKRKETSFKKK